MKNEIGKKERSKCSTHQDMQVGAGGDGGLVFGILFVILLLIYLLQTAAHQAAG